MNDRTNHEPTSHQSDDSDPIITRMFEEGFSSPDVDPKFARELKQRLDEQRDTRDHVTMASRINNVDPGNANFINADSPSPNRRRPNRQWRRLSWGLTAAAAAVLMMVLWPARTAYSFEIMRERLNGKSYVRTQFVDTGRPYVGWLSAAGEFAAVESADAVVVSTQHGALARFNRIEQTIERTSSTELSNRNIQVLKVLGAIQNGTQGSLRVISQSSDRIDQIDGADVQLNVRFIDEEAPQETIDVRFGIDSETELPVWMDLNPVEPLQKNANRLALAYPSQGPSELASLGIPTSLASRMAGGESVAPGIDSVASNGQSDEPVETNETNSAIGSSMALSGTGADSDDEPIAITSVAAATPASESGSLRPSERRWDKPLEVNVPKDPPAMADRIDQRLAEVWATKGADSNPTADAHTLFRRMHLDLTGRIPHVSEIRKTIVDDNLDVEKIVDDMLASPDFDSNMAAVWTRWLLPPDVELEQFGGKPAFEAWLADQFAAHVPYDEITRQLLLAEGRVGDQGPVLFTTALEMKPDHLAKQTARTFLGTRIDCAMCHDHPYDTWTQTDFWGYAALFARISRPVGTMNAMSSVLRVKDVGEGEVTLPDTDQVVPPRLLGAGVIEEPAQSDQRRHKLAAWLTDPSNRQFARATVNLLWSHFFGAGLVEPRDDFGPHNPALSPKLMDELAEYFIVSGYSVRDVVRAIVLSDAYQQTSNADGSEERPIFNSMPIRWLTAEQLYDCLQVASGGRAGTNTVNDPTLGINRFGESARTAFVEQFASSASNTLEYQAGIPQALSLMNGSLSNLAAGEETSRLIRGLQAPFFTDNDRVETVFLSLVGRPPSSEESQAVANLLNKNPDSPSAEILSDLVWALLNGAEFATNH
ncbi:DUF1549 domain-containing protein [Rhodopirellula sp. SWK7]|uniref:DUF1549 domain-containing protein n=1 Tax=Rhodopirellula sp. SWK7 TaxID=595460 RepID=UPI0002C00B0C|nr:DUF1549 domain-containing protein [Rhodopirellula sp. SWK7]EMI40601.1 protein containing DUF1549 [Rhodopirellula sp. SWK7]